VNNPAVTVLVVLDSRLADILTMAAGKLLLRFSRASRSRCWHI